MEGFDPRVSRFSWVVSVECGITPKFALRHPTPLKNHWIFLKSVGTNNLSGHG